LTNGLAPSPALLLIDTKACALDHFPAQGGGQQQRGCGTQKFALTLSKVAELIVGKLDNISTPWPFESSV
jgi:hypothetical protein